MKLYKVILDDNREEYVKADSYMFIDEELKFFKDGTPVADIFIREEFVKGINVESDDYEKDFRIRGGGSY